MSDPETLQMLRESARDWAFREHPVGPRHLCGQGRARWRAMADLGWTAAAVDEQHGGLGLGLDAYCAIAEELGRELVDSPLLSSGFLAPQALADRPELLRQVFAGEAVVAIAFDEGAHHGGPTRAVAAQLGDGWSLIGAKRFVVDGAHADWFLITAQADALELFLAPREACSITAIDTIDGRSMAHVTIDAMLDPTSHIPGGAALIAALCDLGRLGLAAEMLGAATRAFEITLDYLKTREQFGRPIGSFQALQHRAAIMLVDIELARASLAEALAIADGDRAELAQAAATAKFMAGEALHRVSNEMVQMHGGIGMTAEHVAGRYLKWARVSEALFGDSAWLARRYADANGF